MLQYMMIGQVLKPQGVHGEAKVRSYAADPDSFLNWKTLYLKEGEEYIPRTSRCSRVHDGFAYVTLEGCTDPRDVEKLRDRELYIDRAHAAPLAEGEVYIGDLMGCRAVTPDGQTLGTLTDVLQNSSVDVYVFRTSRGTMMAPALQRVFTRVDPEAGVIETDPERLAEVAVYDEG